MTARVRLATAAGLLAIGTLTGCAVPLSRSTPAYPRHGQTQADIERDKAACGTWAQSATKSDPLDAAFSGALGGAAIGAVVGAILGAVIGAPFGLSGTLAGHGAAIGAASWGLAGVGTGLAADQQRVTSAYAACMASHGYNVGR